MTASSAYHAAPTNALKFWAMGHDLFVEIPNKDTSLPNTIIKFPYTQAGLAKAFTLIGAQRYDYAGTPLLALPKAPACSPILARILQSKGLIPK